MLEYEEGFCDCGDFDALKKTAMCVNHSGSKEQVQETEQMKLFKDRLAALLFNLIYYHKYDISIKNAVKDISQCYYYLMQELEIKMRKSEVISGLVSEVLKSKLDTWKDKVIKNHHNKKIIKIIKK